MNMEQGARSGAPLNTPTGQPTNIKCLVEDCDRPYCAKGYCRLHWERQHRTGTAEGPTWRTGVLNPAWKGRTAGYKAIHLRLNRQQRPDACAQCGVTEGRFEWALRDDVPTEGWLTSPEGWRYSTDFSHYRNLCKKCHNVQDLGSESCRLNHPLSGDNLYIQPSNGKRFCRTCQRARRRQRTIREHGHSGAS